MNGLAAITDPDVRRSELRRARFPARPSVLLARQAVVRQLAVARFQAGGTVPTNPLLERLAEALGLLAAGARGRRPHGAMYLTYMMYMAHHADGGHRDDTALRQGF